MPGDIKQKIGSMEGKARLMVRELIEHQILEEPECSKRNCKHYLGILSDDPDRGEINERPYCAAFPNGIPGEIAYGNNKHKTKHPAQQNDIVYEESEDGDDVGTTEEPMDITDL